MVYILSHQDGVRPMVLVDGRTYFKDPADYFNARPTDDEEERASRFIFDVRAVEQGKDIDLSALPKKIYLMRQRKNLPNFFMATLGLYVVSKVARSFFDSATPNDLTYAEVHVYPGVRATEPYGGNFYWAYPTFRISTLDLERTRAKGDFVLRAGAELPHDIWREVLPRSPQAMMWFLSDRMAEALARAKLVHPSMLGMTRLQEE